MSQQTMGDESFGAPGEADTAESWVTCWYAPLIAIGVALLIAMVLALAIVEVLVANAPEVTGSGAWTMPLARAEEAPSARPGTTPARGSTFARSPIAG
jgi:hypothetical protein